jgi:hypothetical protein
VSTPKENPVAAMLNSEQLRLGWIIGLTIAGSLLATVSVYLFWLTPRTLRLAPLITEEYAFFVLSAYPLFWMVARGQHRHNPLGLLPIRAISVLVAVLLFVGIWWLGLEQFRGYDNSDLVESGWIQMGFLRPFLDYPCTKPPLFFIGVKIAYLVFGVRWLAFPLLTGTFTVASFFLLARQFGACGISPAWSLMLATTAELGTNVMSSYWSYNPIASIATIMVFVSTLACLRESEEWTKWLLLAVSLVLLILGKPNSWPVGCCPLVLFFGSRRQRARVCITALVAVLASVAICRAYGYPLLSLLHTYSQLASSRGNPLELKPLEDYLAPERTIVIAIVWIMVVMFVALIVARRTEVRTFWREYFCCVVAGLTSLEMFATNYEIITANLMPLVVALFLAGYRPWSGRGFDKLSRPFVVYVLAFFLVASIYWSVTRLRIRDIGEFAFFEYPATERIHQGFFTGLHTGPRMIRVLAQIKDVVQRNHKARFFFGPRIEFAYAAFSLPAPKGLPIWWHPGTSYSETDLPNVVRSFDRDDFDVLVFLKDDYTRVPFEICFYITHRYRRVSDYGSELDVYVKKEVPDSPPVAEMVLRP